MVGQLGAEDRNVGDRTWEGNGQRTVQRARIESYVRDTWSTGSGEHFQLM